MAPGIRTIFNNLPSSNQLSATLFDNEFADFANWVALPCSASGANSIVLTPQTFVPILPNYGFYNILSFIAVATSTGPVYAQLYNLGLLPVYYANGTTQVGSGGILNGQPYMLQYNPALNSGLGGFYLLSLAAVPPGGSSTPTIFVPGFVTNLVVTNGSTPNTQVNMTCTTAIVPNNMGGAGINTQSVVRSNLNITASTAASGANGLDTGSIANNTWYNVWIIDNGTAPALLLSLSATAPTMPSGYIYGLRVGAMFYGTAQLLKSLQTGADAQWTVVTQFANSTGGAVGNVSTPTWVAVQVRNGGKQGCPPTGNRIRGYVAVGAGDEAMVAPINTYGAVGTATQGPCVASPPGGGNASTPYDFILQNNNIYWATFSTTCYLMALGWRDSVPAV